MVLSEIGSVISQGESELVGITDDEDLYQEEENLSDTDPEDEWESATI